MIAPLRILLAAIAALICLSVAHAKMRDPANWDAVLAEAAARLRARARQLGRAVLLSREARQPARPAHPVHQHARGAHRPVQVAFPTESVRRR